MTPGARIAGAIEILEKIELSRSPAEDVVASYFRSRRYIGSKDRRSISKQVYGTQRRKARIDWLSGIQIPRIRVIVDLFLIKKLSLKEIILLFNGKGYSPESLAKIEIELLEKISEKCFDNEPYPPQIKAEVPGWIANILMPYWGNEFQKEASALNQPASINLRVNTIKGSCARTLKMLHKDKIEANPTEFSPLGLKVKNRVNLRNSLAFKEGFVEIQDEGSQIISALVETKRNLKTIDLCAGSGGKTLALGAAMKNGGSLIACDVDSKRLKKLKPRLARSGLTNITKHHLLGSNDVFYKDHRSSAERVLIDVPCSGSGAWRRTPAQKWRLTATQLKEVIALQQKIMQQAANLVAKRGRLIYSTCSVLPDENEKQISWFLRKHSNFRALSISEIWQRVFDMRCPNNALVDSNYLSLTPARHNTDGFFTAVLEKTNT
ncbi:MAG: RsmB/NOP family class I SAM-dependent RNA methyltransferase [Pseudomonadota bacterium]|nr:RsmB/NOP family class I SAM-dependent RNA methyltransferase [Pseudomonadota bacterium]